jgi:thiamine-monophosphate kinase
MSPEFELIAKHFARPVKNAILGVGDDCALVGLSPGCVLAISTDTLTAGTHFFPDACPEKLGHKALAVNLSDLAAMGAVPRFVTMALTLPEIDERWLAAFSRGFFSLADGHLVELIGGDTTRGPLSITLTALGEISMGHALRRDGAKEGDDVWVSGSLGGAALALQHLRGAITLAAEKFEGAALRLHSPDPRVSLGRALVGIATSAIDISDGLVGDLAHICERSGLSANIAWDNVPLFPALCNVDPAHRFACALAGGDDYELCFTAPQSKRQEVQRVSASLGLPLARVGSMLAGAPVVHVLDAHGGEIALPSGGFDHFANIT